MTWSEFLLETVNALRTVEPDWTELLSSTRREAVCISFVNPHAVYLSRRDPAYAELLSRMDFLFPDGILMARLASALRGTRVERLSFDGNSIAPRVFGACGRLGLRLALVGGRLGVASAVAPLLQERYGVAVAAVLPGYFPSPAARDEAITRILENRAEVAVCGMGAGRQESFALSLKTAGWSGVAFTCGGYLDQVLSGGIEYYPPWIERNNLRAFYRLYKEPRRLAKRYLIDYGPFFVSGAQLLAEAKVLARHAVHDGGRLAGGLKGSGTLR